MSNDNGSALPNAKLQRLQDVTQQLLDHRRLIIASNRGPMEYHIDADGSLMAHRGGGGMVTALTSATRFVPATWVASAMTDGDRLAAERADGGLLQVPENEIYVRFVTVPQSTYQRHYYVFCNPLLWFVQHFMWNTPRTPNIGRAVYEAWESGYIPVNEAIADAVIQEAKNHPEPPYILLQDYHLYLAPAMIREAVPDATILHFTHIPWPGPRYWGILPEFMRRRIHEDLCAADIVGLQTVSDTRNFLHACEALLPGADIDYGSSELTYRDHTTQVRAYPISIDAAGLAEYAQSSEVEQHKAKLATLPQRADDRPRRSLGAQQEHYPRSPRLRASSRALSRAPAQSSTSSSSSCPPAASSASTRRTQTRSSSSSSRSTTTSATSSGSPSASSTKRTTPRRSPACRIYDVLLVNPIIDGMNLVSKEGPLVNERNGVLILSELAGSFEQLSPYCIPVAPTDLEGTVRALHEALTMPEDERRRRAEALKASITEEDITTWLERQFQDLMQLST